MTKISVRNQLQRFEKGKLVDLIMDLYSIKEVKGYLENLFDPQYDKVLNECEMKIDNEFDFTRRSRKRFTTGKKIISDFKKINPPVELIAQLMVYLPTRAMSLPSDYKTGSMEYETAAYNCTEAALKFIQKHGLEEELEEDVIELLEEAKNSRSDYSYRTFVHLVETYLPNLDCGD